MEYLLGFVLLLGVLIFIHEFGHFFIAKLCGVRVETFSIGMGKKFITFRRGETEYALSLLPLGGYVKLTGQDPREEVPAELAHKSFREKPLWKRAAIVLAGPSFNAALAVVVFIGLYHFGVPSQDAMLTRVLPNSAAFEVGLRTGDRITRIDFEDGRSERIRELADIERVVGAAAGQTLKLQVERAGATQTIEFVPVLGPERDSSTGVVRERGTLAGVEYTEPAAALQVIPASWAATRGLPPVVLVEEILWSEGGVERTQKVESFAEFEKFWALAANSLKGTAQGRLTLRGQTIKIVKADDKTKAKDEPVPETETFTLNWSRTQDAPPAVLLTAGLASAELSLVDVREGTPAAKLGLQVGDRIEALNGQRVYSFTSFKNRLQQEAAQGAELHLTWYRGAKKMDAAVKPELVSAEDPMTEAKKNQFQIGAQFLPVQATPPRTNVKGDDWGDTIALGFAKTGYLTKSMLESFYLLAKGEISHKTLGGPILIGKIAGESFKAGPGPFFKMMAFISMNLCILNLLPIPVLDGGHLLLYCIEAVRRRPLSLKIIEAWTTAGFVFLMGLIAIVFFNDLSRLGVFAFFKS